MRIYFQIQEILRYMLTDVDIVRFEGADNYDIGSVESRRIKIVMLSNVNAWIR